MTQKIPTISIVMMGIVIIALAALSVGLLLYFRKKGAGIKPFFLGWAGFFVFAMILEGFVNNIIASSSLGTVIQNSLFLYALYGGVMAALFEEGGRYVMFKYVMKKEQEKDINAPMFGAGYGCFEAVMIVGVTYLVYMVMASVINSGQGATLYEGLEGVALSQMQAITQSIAETPAWMYLLSFLERIAAILMHIGLSVIVWFGVKKNDMKLVLSAGIMHAFADTLTVILAQTGLNSILLEVIIMILACAVVWYARGVWQKHAKE